MPASRRQDIISKVEQAIAFLGDVQRSCFYIATCHGDEFKITLDEVAADIERSGRDPNEMSIRDVSMFACEIVLQRQRRRLH